MSHEHWKRAAAQAALSEVRDGMLLGLGTGSTARHFVDLLGERVRAGLRVTCVPTSEATRAQAEAEGIVVSTLDYHPALDVTVDGADELDRSLALIKGGGAALLREKIVATASRRMVVIADAGKLVQHLGAFPLPVECVRFGLAATTAAVRAACVADAAGAEVTLRRAASGEPLLTDNGNVIVDCRMGAIADPAALALRLAGIPGVVEHGLFLGIAQVAYVAGPDGVAVLTPKA
jgi:ribose 5-phosphate isomerase A